MSERDQNEGSGQQQPIGQQDSEEADGTERQQPQGQQSQQPLGQQQSQQPLGQQQQGDLETREPTLGQSSQQPAESSGSFVGSQSEDSGEYLRKGGNPESGFAEEGRGASNESDVERETPRSQDRDSEGSSDNN